MKTSVQKVSYCLEITVLVLVLIGSSNYLYAQTSSSIDTSEAHRLYEKGVLLIDRAKYDSASVLFRKAAAQFEADDQWNRLAASYNHLGTSSRMTNKLEEAENYSRRALEVLDQYSADTLLEKARAYNNLGLIETEKSEFEAAKELFTEGLTAAEDPSVPPHVNAMLLANMGSVYDEEGAYDEAIEYYEEGIELVDGKNSDKQLRQLAQLYNYTGVTHVKKGLYEQALQFYEREVEINLELLGDSHPTVAGGYNNIGGIYYRAGDIGEAIVYFKRAASVTEAAFGEMHPNVGLIYNNIGACYYQTGDYTRSVEYLKKSARIKRETQGEDHPDLALTYNNIGTIYTEIENYEEAIDFLKQSLSIRKKALGDNHPVLSNNYNTLGNLYLNTDDADRAIEYFQMGLDIAIESRGRRHPYVAEARTNLAKAYRQKEDFSMALASLRQAEDDLGDRSMGTTDAAVTETKTSFLHPIKAADVLHEKGKTLHMQYKQEKDIGLLRSSLATYTQLSGLLDRIQLGFQSEESKLLMGAESHKIYEESIQVSFELFKETGNASYLGDIFFFSEKSKARVILEQLNRQEGKKFAGVPDTLINYETTLRQQLAALQQEIASEESSDKSVKEDSLFILKQRLGEHLDFIEKEYPRYHDFKYRSEVPELPRVNRFLSQKGLTLIEYFHGEESTWAILSDGEEVKVLSLPHLKKLSQKIAKFNKAIAQQNDSVYVRMAHDLYQSLFEPLEKHIVSRSLLVVPDGALNLLPFSALLSEESPDGYAFSELPYLQNKYAINYSPSVSLSSFFEARQSDSYEQKLLAFAPVFSGQMMQAIPQESSRNSWEPLPSTQFEVEQIAGTINEGRSFWNSVTGSNTTTVFMNRDATEATFKRESLNQYQYLHLATHAFTSGSEGERAGIAFFPGEKDSEDGILYTEEIYSLDLRNELVVLSACETGTGEVQTGEGIIGLSRAFQYAGAENMLVSLWNVEDRSTARLMISFYERLEEGAAPAVALRLAQKELLNSYTYAHPRYWAPFIFIGS